MTVDARIQEARARLETRRYGEALAVLQPIITPDSSEEVLALVGEALAGMGHKADAAEFFESAAALGQSAAYDHARRAAELHLAAGNDDKAQLIALRLLQQRPEDPALAFMLITIFEKTGELQLVDALKHRLVESEVPEHLQMAARLLSSDPYSPSNAVVYRKLRALFPNDPYIRFTHLGFARERCEFEVVEKEEAAIRAELARGNTAILQFEEPHAALIWLEDEALLRKAANTGALPLYTEESRRRRRAMPHRWGERIRIGYVSSDLWDDHATMRLLGDVLRHHDRNRFEITLFCATPEKYRSFDGGGRSGWGEIVSIREMDDAAAEAAIRARGIDILVDLKGHTGNHRCGIFNRQAAPVQVAWLGFPGSAAGVDCDYVIGDRFTLPDGSAPHFHELFCRLPESYQPNDPSARQRPAAVSRAALGLPEDVFLFASFNGTKKLTPGTLDIWAEVLKEAPEAHLWIMAHGQTVKSAFARRGIDPARIHPASKCAYADHIARVQAADLALDTFPCNGHTTTSDMLWAGLPVVTMKGQTFAGRVSESLLHAIGLPELVAEGREGFVALASAIARSPGTSDALKARLEENRFRAPLFDSERFCRHLEAAFRTMADRARAGEPPAAFDVPALPPRAGAFR